MACETNLFVMASWSGSRSWYGWRSWTRRRQAVLHILEADGALALLIEVLVLQVFVDLVDKSRTDGVLGTAPCSSQEEL